jgi:hypothetical protein
MGMGLLSDADYRHGHPFTLPIKGGISAAPNQSRGPAETVTVAGESPTVDVTSLTFSKVVDSKRIVELPLNGRDAAS